MADASTSPDAPGSHAAIAAGHAVPSRIPEWDEADAMPDTIKLLLEQAAAEHRAAEGKREAAITKASGLATLAAALIAIVAAPALDMRSLSHSGTRWVMLGAILVLLGAIGCAAGALLVRPRPGERADAVELDNWTTPEFRQAALSAHSRDFIEMFVDATKNLRTANERAESWLVAAVIAVAASLVLLIGAFMVEIL
jgi:Na+/melibiose symporter-like transporter